jgi:hypothetical protein
MSSGCVSRKGRRHFLAGLGGFALAIPFLPSLERTARAGPTSVPPRYFYLGTNHGGCWDASFFPTTPLTTQQAVAGVPAHTVSSGALAATTSGGTTALSKVLSASSGTFTSTLVAKMNVLRGLDVPWYVAHNTGLLGNFARNDANGGDGGAVQAVDHGGRPTIDQIMASSSSFYSAADRATTKALSLILGGGTTQPHSWALTTPGSVEGGVTPVTNSLSSLPLFQSIFGTGMPATATPRKPVIDLVLGNYNSLLQSNTRLSAADKVRLNQHVDMLHTLEGTLGAKVACATVPPAPADNANYGHYGKTPDATKWGQLYVDVLVAAFACGATRIGVFGFGDTNGFSPGFAASGSSDWHQDVAHKWYLDEPQGWLLESYQGLFEKVFLYLASTLDGMQDADGRTLLDNSLLVWGQECCMETHEQYGIQTVSFGSAGGALHTGLYCDYRHMASPVSISPSADGGSQSSAALNGYVTHPGLLWEQWLATQLLAMGIPTSDWELWKDASGNVEHGYGTPYVCATGTWEPSFALHYLPNDPHWAGGTPTITSSPYFQNASQPLPFLMG